MKPKRFFRRPPFLSGSIRYGAPVALGLTVFISGLHQADAGIYGSGSGTSPSSGNQGGSAVAGGGTNPAASDAARAAALQAMRRSDQALQAAVALQAAARAAAGNSAGPGLPAVPNGLAPGGLDPAPGAVAGSDLWQGAELPAAAADNLNQITVRQTAQQALLTWQTFNVGKNTTLYFNQTNTGAAPSQSIAFNKVVDPAANPTQILGQIQSEGQVYIINPNGIIFGGSSQVNTGALTASALPINPNLVANGLLNNPDAEFLFDGLNHASKLGDVTVQAGARITTPVSADGNGGRISLIGANVTNSGTLTSPNGQVILAAGLQVAVAAHDSSDPSLRGLDVYVGAVTDPASTLDPYAGTATNNGIISIPRANAAIAGKNVIQNGIIDSTTSVDLNGRIDLLASYNAIGNPSFNPATSTNSSLFLNRDTGHVSLGEGSVTRILPELESTDTVVGTELALRSQINLRGKTIHIAEDASIHAPNAIVNVDAGIWQYLPGFNPVSLFTHSEGQIYIDHGAHIYLAGTVDASASASQNILTLELRGSELAVALDGCDGELRGQTITVDLGVTGYYEGRFWVGTPLADLTGYVGLVERNIGQLTTAGGTLNLSSGGSVVIQNGATIDVSGGWTNYTGATVATTKLLSNGAIVDISQATPDRIYDGVYNGKLEIYHPGWGVTESFSTPLNPASTYFRSGYLHGADGGSLEITAAAQALDGNLVGRTVAGQNQIRNSTHSSSLPQAARLSLNFQSAILQPSGSYLTGYPTPPDIHFSNGTQSAVGPFSIDAGGNPAALPADRASTVFLSPEKLAESGFGSLSISNPEGSVTVPETNHLRLQPGASLEVVSSNIDILGSITTPGGNLSFTALNISPYQTAQISSSSTPITPAPNAGKGILNLSSTSLLDTSGLVLDDRSSGAISTPASIHGGSVSLTAFATNLAEGSVIDVSGGYLRSINATETYGDAGSIHLAGGQDPILTSVLGGSLQLGSTLRGYSGLGTRNGSLSLLAPLIQIGGSTTNPSTLLLDPEFFYQGGFGNFTLTGLGQGSAPAVWVTPGTEISPVVKNVAAFHSPAGLVLRDYEEVNGSPAHPGLQAPVSITLASPGARDYFSGGTVTLGNVTVDEGAVIRVNPGGSITTSGATVAILGSLIAPGGNLNVSGSTNSSPLFSDAAQARATTFLGSNSLLSTRGATVLVPDLTPPLNRRLGSVLGGGNISVSGNLVAASGSVIDVSGHADTLDVPIAPSGTLNNPGSLATRPTLIESNAGSITLSGGQILLSEATLIGEAGGSSALGGTLNVSSNRFYALGQNPLPPDVTLTVTQSGPIIGALSGNPIGQVVPGALGVNGGHFTIDSFANGGFDSLNLNGVVRFQGPVDIQARGQVSFARQGFLFADSSLSVQAGHVAIGTAFAPPVLPEDETSPFLYNGLPYYYPATHGTGSLDISARTIDVGNLTFQNIGSASLSASQGDIRGNGTFTIAGDLTLQAGQIYPTTAADFIITAYDRTVSGITEKSTVTILGGANRHLPLSAGGELSIYASNIIHHGTLRAPFGTINLGWDGTGTAPLDRITGTNRPLPVTENLTLSSGSVTSVSGVDPLTGKGIVVPYGVSTDGTNWIDPRGVEITAGGLPQKTITLSGSNVALAEGATVDLRGGGDLYANRFTAGLGGPVDILNTTSSFAIIPSFDGEVSPYAAYNTSTSSTNLINGAAGFTNAQLKPGDRIYLEASKTLPAGYYTLLPARYALLPGAVLVTPRGAGGFLSYELPGGSSIVSGTRYNSLNTSAGIPAVLGRFELFSSEVVRTRATYENFLANAFLPGRAAELGAPSPILPADSGYLLFQASQSLDLSGSVLSRSIDQGRGASIDISSQLDIHIGSQPPTVPGLISLDSADLTAFEAESLLIGGRRTRTADGTTVDVRSNSITVDNTGSTLAARDLVLAASNSITVAEGSILASTGTAGISSEILNLTENGALIRVSADPSAQIVRTGVTAGNTATLNIGASSTFTGGALIFDSSSTLDLSPAANLLAQVHSFNSGKISLQLDGATPVPPTGGLILTTASLLDLQGSEGLSLLSYSSIDVYGNGSIGGESLRSLSLNAGEIRGVGQDGGEASIVAREIILENTSNLSSGTAPSSTGGSLVIDAGVIRLGANTSTINSYTDVVLKASRGIIGEGKGGLVVQDSLTTHTPLITGTAGAVRTITAGGAIELLGSAAAGNPPKAGLGSSLTITGNTVAVDTSILLPTGTLDLNATHGDLTVSGNLDVSGTAQHFYDVTRFTPGGGIRLSSEQGDVHLTSASSLNLSAPAGGAGAGTLEISTPLGTASLDGSITAKGGNGGNDGSFVLDVRTLGSLSALNSTLSQASLTHSQDIRVRTGNVEIDGLVSARDFTLSTDQGSITLTGRIDASGQTGGSVHLSAHRDLILASGSSITVAAADFDAAGKGGGITLEAGSQTDGTVGDGTLTLQSGSSLDLSVTASTSASAAAGKFTGKLHLRAPLLSSGTDLRLSPLDSTITGASSILVEGYRLYDLTSVDNTITTELQDQIKADGEAFLGASGSSALSGPIASRLLANNAGLGNQLVLAPGAEIIHRTGNLELGSTTSNASADWNLASFRFGEKRAPGVLTIRAAGDLVFHNALSDGFSSSAYNATLLDPSSLLPVNTQSWSFRLSSGSDLSAADHGRVLSLAATGTGGSLLLGKNNFGNASNSNGSSNNPGNNAQTSTALTNRFQVIRTGSGDIDIHAARSIQLLNHFATIYTTGTKVADATLGGAFDLPVLNQTGGNVTLGADQQTPLHTPQYSLAGGNVSLFAGLDIEHITRNNQNQVIQDSQRQLPNNWLNRRGYVDPVTGTFAAGRWGDISTTTWWVDFTNFFQGIGALGGGNVSLIAGNNINNVDAVIPTNARMPKVSSSGGNPTAADFVELGGGNLIVRAGNDLNAGVYYVERGHGEISAGGNIVTNATRSPSNVGLVTNTTALDAATWLPTTLFLGKGGFDVSALGNVLLGPVANPFLLPPGINNTYWQKSYFSTYAPDSHVNVASYGGGVTLRQSTTLPSSSASNATPILLAWIQNQQLLRTSPASASFYQPWLRLAETSVDPFRTSVSLLPGTITATSFSSDINLVGSFNLTPSPTGTIDLFAGGAINGLQRNGLVSLLGVSTSAWGAARINVSDADPASIPGILNPYGHRTVAGNSQSIARQTQARLLEFFDKLFRESGGTLGAQSVLETKQSLHASGILHRHDTTPVRLYSGSGDISGLTLFSPKAARVISGRDISDIALYIQNVSASDVSVVASARDIIPYTTNSPLRSESGSLRNIVNLDSPPLAGDIQISGPGTLEVLAGRNLDLGTGSNLSDGTGAGIISIGNARNPFLPFTGADLVIGAGISDPVSLSNSSLDFESFIEKFVTTPEGEARLKEADPDGTFPGLDSEQQALLAVEIFNLILRDVGRDYPQTGSYDLAYDAIETLFGSIGEDETRSPGDIHSRSRDIRTANGGNIHILTPGGGLSLADTAVGNTLSPPGIITASGGNISIFAQDDVSIGIGRIFTLRGGNEIIWSTLGNIAAGSSSKTVASAPPTRVLIDPQSAAVQTDLAGLATGGGIGVLATVKGVIPGNVDLIAPNGFVDAGDAGIRSTGNLNIAANQVLNAGNISTGGTTTGAAVSAPAAVTTVSTTPPPASASSTTSNPADQTMTDAVKDIEITPTDSDISVEVIGYGGSSYDDEDEDEEEKRRSRQAEEQQEQQ